MQYGINAIGQLEYILAGTDGCEYGVFEYPKQIGNKCRILRFDPNAVMVTDACIFDGLPIADTLPAFDSFIKAARFLKANIERLA